MDNTLPRFEAFPSYVSCIKNYGRSILPPLLSSAQRQEMAEIRHQAIIAEARIARRSIQKPSLMNKAKEIMEKIEKSQVNLSERHAEGNGSGDHLLASVYHGPTNPPCINLPSTEQGDNITKMTLQVNENFAKGWSCLNSSSVVQGTESCLSETEDTCSVSSCCKDTSSQAAYAITDSNTCIMMSSTCDQNPVLSTTSSFVESHLHKNFEASKFQSTSFPHDSSENFELNNIESSEGDEWVENGDSSSTYVTSDVDETENASMATVILKSCEELHNDTDSDSLIASAAQSTDLEKYFDSPSDCQFSESSEQMERTKQNECSTPSVSSDFESNATLVNSSTELTPVPCLVLSDTSKNSNRCESGESHDPFSCEPVRDSFIQEEKEKSSFQTHMRRSSYTLDKPSPALLQAFACSPSEMNGVNSDISMFSNGIVSKPASQETVLQIASLSSVCLATSQVSEENDHSYAKDSSSHISGVDQWAYQVTHDFCDNSELCDEASVRNNTCDTSGDLGDIETFNISTVLSNISTLLSSQHDSSDSHHIGTFGSAFETRTNGPSYETEALTSNFDHGLFLGRPDIIDESLLTRIFENLQEFQRQKVEKLQEEQRRQWEKLHLEFQEQEAILHEQLNSLYVTTPPVSASKHDDCPLEATRSPMQTRASPGNYSDLSSCTVNSVTPVASPFPAQSPPFENKEIQKYFGAMIADPKLKAKFDRVSATVKGYLTRRLMKTERVQGIIQTIKDTLLCAVKFHEETPVKKGFITEQDADLHQRLISQITAACCELHDIFFKISTKERMLIISQSRELARERNKIDKGESELTQMNLTAKTSPRSKAGPALSSATMKYLERKNLRSSGEGKNVCQSAKSKTSSRVIQKRPILGSSRRSLIPSPPSLRNSKRALYGVNTASTKSSTKNAKSVRRLIYSRTET